MHLIHTLPDALLDDGLANILFDVHPTTSLMTLMSNLMISLFMPTSPSFASPRRSVTMTLESARIV
jgi:hypothetical protein